MPVELFANATAPTTPLVTALSAAISSPLSSSGTFTVTSSTGFPAAVTGVSQFRCLIDSELFVVTNVSGTTWTATGGQEGTTATTHSSGATVVYVITAAALAGLAGLSLVASTGVAGFALANSTSTILTWTAPNDGALHRCLIFASINVGSTSETGGQIQDSITLPNNSTVVQTVFNANLGAFTAIVSFLGGTVGPGKVAALNQSTALTGGSATLWAEIWAL